MAARRKARTVAEQAVAYVPRRILLDTHVWLWWCVSDRRLGREAIALIKKAPEVRLSAASAWEISIKRALGKVIVRGSFDIVADLERDGFQELPISIAHAEALNVLPRLHRDPFDRMIIAQAQSEGLVIVTADDAMAQYGVPVIDARR